MKYCCDCKHFKARSEHCFHPRVFYEHELWGKMCVRALDARREHGTCKPSAKFFEERPKPSFFERLFGRG